MRVKARKQIFKNVIDFPVKDADGAVTLVSEELAPFEATSPGALNYHLFAADDSEITNTVTVTMKVSFDGGTNWIDADDNIDDLKNGSSGAISVYNAEALKSAPRIKFVAELDDSSRITEDAKPGLVVEMEEREDLERSKIFSNIISLDETVADTTVNGETFYVGNTPEEVVVSHSGDSSKMTNIQWKLQSSFDGNSWWDVNSNDNISTSSFKETSLTAKLGKYFRVALTAGNTGLAEDHNLVFNAVCFYN